MRKYHLKEAIAIVLVSVIMLLLPAQVLAQSNGTLYISDIAVASDKNADTAKKELTDKGYTVFDNDLNAGTGKDFVYIGYKTTDKSYEAITDLRIMDMNGGYSATDYANAIKTYEEQISKELQANKEAIEEFRDLFKDGDKAAVYAYKQLNHFIEDDSQKLIGNIFTADEIDFATLTKVFMQGNEQTIKVIQQILAIAFSDDWLGDAAENTNNEYSDSETTLDEACASILENWDVLRGGLVQYAEQKDSDEGYNLANYTDESFNSWSKTATDSQKETVIYYGTAYHMLEKYQTSNGTNFTELFMKDKKDLVYKDLYPIAEALSTGSLQSMKYTGMTYAIQLNDIDIDQYIQTQEKTQDQINKKAVEVYNSQVQNEGQKITEIDTTTPESVYNGVDRSLFDTNSGVALTNDALRSQASTTDKRWGFKDCFKKLSSGFTVALGLTVVFGGIIVGLSQFATTSIEIGFEDEAVAQAAKASGAKIGLIIAGVGVLIAAVGIGISIYEYYHPTYTAIPRAMVDEITEKTYDKDGKQISSENKYVAYYAAFDTEDPGSGTRKFGDLNGWGGRQWNALYYTKNPSAGKPITTDFIIKLDNSEVSQEYTALRYFGQNNSAFNLNSHAFKSNSPIYLYYKANANASTVGSSFSFGYIAISAAAGIIIGGLAVYLVLNRKRKTEDNVTQ